MLVDIDYQESRLFYTVDQDVVVVALDFVHILAEHPFPIHGIDQRNFQAGEFNVRRHQVTMPSP